MIRNNSREAILRKIQAKTGFEIDQNGLSTKSRQRISALIEILRTISILERFIRDEIRKSQNLSYRISSMVNRQKTRDLESSSLKTDEVKSRLWSRCDVIALDIMKAERTDDEVVRTGNTFIDEPVNGSNSMKCPVCGGNIIIHSYDNYECSDCGLGFSAIDYLNRIGNMIDEI